MRADSAVEPTKLVQKYYRDLMRSASVRGAGVVISGKTGVCPVLSAATALNSLSRAPSGRPSSRRCSSVRSQSTSASMALSRKRLRVLLQTDPCRRNVDVQVPGLLSAVFGKWLSHGGPPTIPRGFLNRPWICHVDAKHSTAA